MTAPFAALFDLDGVLIDTESQYTAYWAEQGHKYFPGNPQFATAIKGMALTTIFSRFFCNNEAAQLEIRESLRLFEQNMHYPFFDGALLFIRQLHDAGIPIAIVTSSDKMKMQQLYRAQPELPRLVDRIFTAEDAKRSKPAPDCYLNAAQQLGYSIDRCVVFEDSANGLQAGMASGAFVVGMATGLELEDVKAMSHKAVRRFGELDIEELCLLAEKNDAPKTT